MRVLVLGGTGFVGRALTRRLLEAGHSVAAFHRGETSGGAETIRGDRRELAAHRKSLAAFVPDVVVDTIAYTEADAVGLAEAFRGVVSRIVVLSSQDVYAAYGRLLRLENGEPSPELLSEGAPLRSSRHPYRAIAKPGEMAYDYDKVLVESAVRSAADAPVTVLRLPCVYGPGDRQRRLRPYLDRLLAASAEPLHLDRAKASWRWTRGYVEDVADGIALATTDPRASGRIYNLGEPAALSESEWIGAIAAAAGISLSLRAVAREDLPPELAEPYDFSHDLAADTSRIRRELGYRERVGAAEGLRRTVAAELGLDG